jgi:ankyrin repeat protein
MTTTIELNWSADLRSGANLVFPCNSPGRRPALHRLRVLAVLAVILLLAVSPLPAATNDLTSLLQQGLFEEEANRNLAAAITSYQSLATKFDQDRQIAATAVFRLGECYRKLGRTNDAVVQYERIVREFSDQPTLATLSRQNLAGLGSGLSDRTAADRAPTLSALSPGARTEQRRLLQEEIELVEKKLAGQRQIMSSGRVSQADIIATQQELLALKRQLIAVSDDPSLSPNAAPSSPAATVVTDEEEQEIRRIQAMIRNSPDLISAPSGDPSMTPLERAASKGQLRVAEFLLKAGAEVNPTRSSTTPLHRAARAGHKTMVELLVRRGANVNALSSYQQAPLHYAAEKGFVSVVEILLTAGADPNLRDSSGSTPLALAAFNGFRNVMEPLLRNRADPNLTTTNPPAYYTEKDRQQSTGAPLHFAAFRGDAAMVSLLLANHADVQLGRPWSKETALNIAAGRGDTNVARLLIAAGANVNAAPLNGGFTPLHTAASNCQREMVRLLLEKGALPNANAVYRDPDTTPLMIAAERGDSGIVCLLLDAKADPNPKTTNGYSALLWAIWSDQADLVKLLLAHRADANARKDGIPLLETALRSTNAVFAAMIEAKPDLNARNAKGRTALHHAVQSGLVEKAEMLLAAGADPNIRDNDGLTPLDLLKSMASASSLPRSGLPAPGTPSSSTRSSLADLLRHYGALDDLPRFDRIQVSRPSARFSATVFLKGTNDWNRFTLFDLVGVQYDLLTASTKGASRSRPAPYGSFAANNLLPFPDLARVVIHRPTGRGTNWSKLEVDLVRALDSGDCSADVPLQFGDVVEIPEADHVLDRTWTGLTTNALFALKKCLTRHLSITVKGQTTNLIVAPQVEKLTPGSLGYIATFSPSGMPEPVIGVRRNEPMMLQPVLENSGLMRASSDRSRVKVTRREATSGKSRDWVIDCSGDYGPDFWVRDGDVIEVPEK